MKVPLKILRRTSTFGLILAFGFILVFIFFLPTPTKQPKLSDQTETYPGFALEEDATMEPCDQLPILEPDGSTLPETPLNEQTCLARYGRNILEIQNNMVTFGSWLNDEEKSSVNCVYSTVEMENDLKIKFLNRKPIEKIPAHCPSPVFNVTCTYQPRDLAFYRQVSYVFRCYGHDFKEPTKHWKQEKLNVVMIGLDSLARVAWYDQLPKTVTFIEDHPSSFIMNGYNVIGDGTTAALLALLTGYQDYELPEARRGFEKAQHIDGFPFIWNALKQQSKYVTLYDEDQPSIGTFQHRLMGFKTKPVDYYGRPFQLACKEAIPKFFDCLGGNSTFEEMLNQVDTLFQLHPFDPKFSLIFNGAFSRPLFDGSQDVSNLDDMFVDALRRWEQKGFFNNTVFILFSDHGARNGRNRATPRGKLEERMPMMSLILPQWFLQQNPEAKGALKVLLNL